MRRILLLLLLGCTSYLGRAQAPDIVSMEYFIDADPGRGSGTLIAFTRAPVLDFSFTVPTSSLSIGFHVLTVRAQDENFIWGIMESKPFYVSLSSTSVQNDITAMEYFIDSDPGRGSGVSIPITANAIQNLAHNIPTGTLSNGFHLLTIRAQDEQGQWSMSESKPFFVSESTTTTPNQIDKLEYFINIDPGRGSGIDIPVSANTNLNVLTNVPTGSLLDGFYIITVRARDVEGVWSLSESKPFFVSKSTTTTPNQIDKLEYFIDIDPGRGSGIDIPVTANTNLNVLTNVPTGSLTDGFHIITVRARDVEGVWSLSESKPFFVSESTTTSPNQIDKLEYFIDIDPGRGSGIDIPVTANTDLNVLTNVPTGSLTDGFHLVTVRARDIQGVWSLSESKPFYITSAKLTSNNEITSFEYYFDIDPGHGSGIAIPVTPNDSIDIISNINISGLSKGMHTLFIRAADDQGQWSFVESKPFYVDEQRKIVAYEYALDVDPGLGNATFMTFPPTDSTIVNLVIETLTMPLGAHTLYVRFRDEFNFWSKTEIAGFTVCDGAQASIIADTVCVGSPTTLLDLSANVIAGDIYSWDFDGDGFEDDNTTGDKSIIYPVAGTYDAILTIDRSGCIGDDTVTVVVADEPIANAGIDQALCNTATLLSANPAQANETGDWTIFSGAGVLSDLNNPSSGLDNITSSSIELVWTLTNTLANCADTDTVSITANLPIFVPRTISGVDIGASINTDVQTEATINIGDVLTTTIINTPLYGVASVLADGTIDYDPHLDAPSLDSLLFRITNQCSNISENYSVYSITNAPPTIGATPIEPDGTSSLITFDLNSLISDPNNNIDLSSLSIVTQPLSGAIASIDVNGILTIDYTDVIFSGTDEFQIQVCDLLGVCSIQTILIADINVGGENPPITVFNAVSPNGDGYNDFLFIENIDFYMDNTVIILNRWGGEIQRLQGYNNQNVVFNDSSLPSGTYFYHILTGIQDVEPITGHFILKTDN